MDLISVGSTGEFDEGEPRAVDVGGLRIAVVKAGDRLYAFDDTCTHQGCSLSEGHVDGSSIVCPCHGGTFDMATGEVLAGPPPTPVNAYHVEVVDEEVLIAPSDQAA